MNATTQESPDLARLTSPSTRVIQETGIGQVVGQRALGSHGTLGNPHILVAQPGRDIDRGAVGAGGLRGNI